MLIDTTPPQGPPDVAVRERDPDRDVEPTFAVPEMLVRSVPTTYPRPTHGPDRKAGPVTSPSRVRHTDMNDRAEPTAADDLQPTLERLHGTTRSDDTVLSALYETHRSELFAFLVRMTRDRDAAEEVLQESFIRLIREARAGRMPDAVRPWLYRVATNEAISRARRRARWTRLLPRLVDRRVPMPPEGEVERTERQAELNAALAALSPDGRAAMLLAAQGFSGHEIATSIGRTEGATRTLLCRSRVQLRHVLEAEEGRS